jgi:hypothetical protein
MIWCRLPGASSLGLLGMIEHYQKRIEASRYLVEAFSMRLVVRSCRHGMIYYYQNQIQGPNYLSNLTTLPLDSRF